jgi:hypothetical protein
MQYTTTIFFGQSYGACSYGGSSYQNSTCGTTTNTSPSAASGSVLTNTGFDILVIVTIACVLALLAVLVRFWKRPAKKKAISSD